VPPKGAGVWASHRLRLPRIKAAIAAKLDELSRQTNVNAERVILELARVGFSDLRRVFREDGTLKDPRDWDDDTAAAIKSIKVRREKDGDAEIVEINTWDKCAALDKLGRHLRLFDGEDTEKLKEAARRLTDLSEEIGRAHV